MGVSKYVKRGLTLWQVDETLVMPDGREKRFRKRCIPTKEQAVALAAKVRAEAFEGRFFDRPKKPSLTVAGLWSLYEPVSQRENRAAKDDRWRARHIVEHMGPKLAALLHQGDVDDYRTARSSEKTRMGKPPAPATQDLEVELLKRMLGYAVRCNKIPTNPLARVKLLKRPNIRRSVIGEEGFERLFEAASPPLRPILLVAFDTGMRLREILDLTWDQVSLKERTIRLAAQDTKTETARVVILTSRVVDELKRLPRQLLDPSVFTNPATGQAWRDIRKMFCAARKTAKLEDLWFHDLRRSFVTRARKLGVPESVVMRMSGHKTRSVFDRYNVVDETDVRAAVGRLEAAVPGAVPAAVGQGTT
ncbi:MAG TPA: site-specific integrase [Myxococcota bacterium]|nr:site-specific integrase [Myxococcota bacterium]HRY96666.1 site-specific integrase [Myxococcota bacterium]